MVVVLKQMMRSNRNRKALWTLALTMTLAGCGGGGGSSSMNAVVPADGSQPKAAASFTITSDDYGMQNATFLAASGSEGGMVLRAAIASSLTDPAFRTTVRVDIDTPAQVIPQRVYSLGGASGGTATFPGRVYFFDGHASTLLETVGGTITFTSFGTRDGDLIAGSFSATVLDGYDSARSTYTIGANFSFNAGSSGSLLPGSTPIPSVAAATYEAHCAACHSLGSYDGTAAGACELALKGGKLRELLTPDAASHQGVRLAAAEISALKILLNAN